MIIKFKVDNKFIKTIIKLVVNIKMQYFIHELKFFENFLIIVFLKFHTESLLFTAIICIVLNYFIAHNSYSISSVIFPR